MNVSACSHWKDCLHTCVRCTLVCVSLHVGGCLDPICVLLFNCGRLYSQTPRGTYCTRQLPKQLPLHPSGLFCWRCNLESSFLIQIQLTSYFGGCFLGVPDSSLLHWGTGPFLIFPFKHTHPPPAYVWSGPGINRPTPMIARSFRGISRVLTPPLCHLPGFAQELRFPRSANI